MEIGDRRFEIRGAEVGPETRRENQLGIRALPEQKIAQSLLPAGANQEIHVAGA
jgi:hypothetical protein